MAYWDLGRGLTLVGLVVLACGHQSEPPEGENLGGMPSEGPVSGAGGEAEPPSAGQGGGNEPEGGAAGSEAGTPGAGEANGGGAPPLEQGAVDCDGEPISLDEARVRQCVMLTSCTGGRFSPDSPLPSGALSRLGSCVTNGPTLSDSAWGGEPPNLPGPWPATPWTNDARLEACGPTLTSCDDVLDCAGFRLPLAECEDGALARCEGDLAINCGDDPLVVDCAKTTGQSGSCEVLGSGGSARAACVLGEECQAESPELRCDGDVAYACQEGKAVGADCSAFGQKCYETKYLGAVCAPAPSEVDCDWREFRCLGDLLTYCTPDQKRYTVDCAAGAEVTCYEGGQEPPDPHLIGCHPVGCDSGSFYVEDECDGDDVVIALGHSGSDVPTESASSRARVHCPDYGFQTCRDGRCAEPL